MHSRPRNFPPSLLVLRGAVPISRYFVLQSHAALTTAPPRGVILTHLETPNTYADLEYKLQELHIVREDRDKNLVVTRKTTDKYL